MGLKTTNYEVKKFGITVPTAYARLTNVSIDVNGDAFGVFEIHQERDDLTTSEALDRVYLTTTINKDLPIYSQIYTKAKAEIFTGWEDDIVEEILSEVE
mgnify:CR=1 FL=1